MALAHFSTASAETEPMPFGLWGTEILQTLGYNLKVVGAKFLSIVINNAERSVPSFAKRPFAVLLEVQLAEEEVVDRAS